MYDSKMLFAENKFGEIVYINDVKRGKRCECICISCKSEVVAKQGKILLWHFAHSSKKGCNYSSSPFETNLHLASKNIFQKNKQLLFPEVYFGNEKIYNGGLILFEQVQLEKKQNNRFTPDAIALKEGKSLWIEFAVTHFCETPKIEYCISNKITLLEIDLSHLSREIDEVSLTNFLIKNKKSRYFIYSHNLFKKALLIDININDYLVLKNRDIYRRTMFNLSIPLPNEKQFYESKIQELEAEAKIESKILFSSEKKWIERKVKTKNHLNNWWSIRKDKVNKKSTPLLPSEELVTFVNNLLEMLPEEKSRSTFKRKYEAVILEEEEEDIFDDDTLYDIECNTCGIHFLAEEKNKRFCSECLEFSSPLKVWERENEDY